MGGAEMRLSVVSSSASIFLSQDKSEWSIIKIWIKILQKMFWQYFASAKFLHSFHYESLDLKLILKENICPCFIEQINVGRQSFCTESVF